MSCPHPFCFSILLLLSLCGILGLMAQTGDSEIYSDYNENYTNYNENYTDYNDNYTDYDYNYTDYDYTYGDNYPEGEFRCTDGVKSVSIYARCDGQSDCLDSSDENGCSEICKPNQFECQENGERVCLDVSLKCDGIVNCNDIADELASECDETVGESKDKVKDADDCGNPAKFKCRYQGQIACLSKEHYQCNGNISCDDWKDEVPSTCDNCDSPGLFKCKDGSQCVKAKDVCDQKPHCVDGSDESDTWANCNSCQEEGSVPCPGFEDICATPCDGNVQCPDQWDELLATCEALGQPCSEEACTDGSKCIREENFCDNFKDCGDGEDESSKHCKDKCESLDGTGNALLPCDNSCIRLEQACSSHIRPLCEDGADMNSSLCEGKCYHEYPGRQDPYRRPCFSEGKCILMTSIHDGSEDCEQTTDEQGRPWYADLNLVYTVLLSVAVVILAWLLHDLISTASQSLGPNLPNESNPSVNPISSPTLTETPAIPLDNLAPGKSLDEDTQGVDPTLPSPNSCAPSFLGHSALVDIDNPKWSWQDIGEELGIEDIFLNQDSQSLVALLSHIEAQDAHPKSLQKAFRGFLDHLATKGHSKDAVAISMKKSIGHHRLGLMVLAGPPNIATVRLYEMRVYVEDYESAGCVFYFLIPILRTIMTSIFPLFFFLDYVKDLVLYPLVRDTVKRLDGGCKNISALGFSCLAASDTEVDILNTFLIAISLSIIATSLFAFSKRKEFFKSSPLLDAFLFISSPLLPAIYHIHVALCHHKLQKKKKKISNFEYQEEMLKIQHLRDFILKAKSIEIGLEAIVQILLLFGFGTFVAFSFVAPSGQSYSYFYSVAKLVLKGNRELVAFSILVSFVGPTLFYTKQVNHLRHNSISFANKLLLTAQNILFLAARLGAITLALFIPIICQWNVFSRNAGIDGSTLLGYATLSFEFDKFFGKALNTLSTEVRTRSFVFLFCVVLHLLAVYLHASFRSSKFVKSKIVDRCLHLISSFWLPLPFLDLAGPDRGEEEAELWFLIALHSVENFALLISSVFVHFEGNFALGLLAIQISVLCVNLLGVLLSVAYNKRFKLYAGLQQQHPSSSCFESKVDTVDPLETVQQMEKKDLEQGKKYSEEERNENKERRSKPTNVS